MENTVESLISYFNSFTNSVSKIIHHEEPHQRSHQPTRHITLKKDQNLSVKISRITDDVRKLHEEFFRLEEEVREEIERTKTTFTANKRDSRMHLRYSNIGRSRNQDQT